MISAILLVAAAAVVNTQTVSCPKSYQGHELVGAEMYLGEVEDNVNSELMGDRVEIQGGWRISYWFNPGDKRRLVCFYEGDRKWTKPLDSETIKCVVLELKKGRKVTDTITCGK
jgi:hypothetical protein